MDQVRDLAGGERVRRGRRRRWRVAGGVGVVNEVCFTTARNRSTTQGLGGIITALGVSDAQCPYIVDGWASLRQHEDSENRRRGMDSECPLLCAAS